MNEVTIPIWNMPVKKCGPDISCHYYENGKCTYKNKLICPNPECIKRKITGYKSLKSSVMCNSAKD